MRDSHRKVAGPGRLLSRFFVLACLASLLLCPQGKAVTILTYGQLNPADVVTLHNDGAGHSTLSTAGNPDGAGVSVPVTITNLNGVPLLVPIVGFETFVNVHSTAPATINSSGDATQPFDGTVEITSLAGGLGVNYLTAMFTNITLAMHNTLSGTPGTGQLQFKANEPPESLVFTSAVITTLGLPRSMGLTFTNVSPPVQIANGSLGALGNTTMTSAGNFSAGTGGVVPEPSSFLVAGIGGLGLIAYGLRRRRTLGV
jgi:hypothetical protein